MALTLREWLKSSEFQYLKTLSPREFFEKEFMRNPIRALEIDWNIVKSPADGVLMYSGNYDASQSILEIKGRKYRIKEILMDEKVQGSFYVSGIFLTSYSVHVVRAITKGIIVDIIDLPPLKSANMSMTLFEQGLYNEKFVKDWLDFNFYNQRKIVVQYVPHWNTYVYYVLIADFEVKKFLLFVNKGDVITQGERLAYVCFGSQVDVLIQKKPWIRAKKLILPGFYVFGGEDNLFQIYLKQAKPL